MFQKILIANRGEIAIRVIRAAKKLGIKTVAVYSEPDRGSLHARLADESYCIGAGSPQESYLSIPNIMTACEISRADAIHPGYGFLSENVSFAEICESYGVKFIGPPSKVIEIMGNKSRARKEMEATQVVPITPGSPKSFQDCEEALHYAQQHLGFPVLIKASAGGGGRGMRPVYIQSEFQKAFNTARNEAEIAFDSGDLYLEKLLVNPRHIEVQILCDSFGNAVHLGERECSIQRRHQKLIEESPSPGISPKTRDKILKCAVTAAKAIGYINAGTFEFLVGEDENFYFMEMNTRLQVEHGVTEMVTALDLVDLQIRIAAGEKLPFTQEEILFRGHCIECRINAEDPDFNFAPSPGKFERFIPPGGPFIRLDTFAHQEGQISPHYDSMFGKLMAWGQNRPDALARMGVALDEFQISGIKTTIPLYKKLLKNKDFQDGRFGTQFLEAFLGG